MNYLSIYENIIKNAQCRNLNTYAEKHHIIPRCMNGSDDPSNLVDLTAKEHFICHLLLSKIYQHHGLISAVWLMSRRGIYSSRNYETLKIQFSQCHSKFMKGKSFATSESKRKGIATKRAKGTINLSENTKLKISEATKGRASTTSEVSRIKNSINSKGRKWVNDGINSTMAKDEKLQELLSSGWVIGRLLTDSLLEGTRKGGTLTGGHNRGTPMSEEQKAKCSTTFFKKGQAPHNKKVDRCDS